MSTTATGARLMARYHDWLAELDLDDNEVIGKHIDVSAGFVLGNEQSPDVG